MERFYALVARTAGVPFDPARAAWLEVEWWRVHRERQHGGPDDGQELERALAHLYAYAYDVPADAMLEAARWRVRAMDLSDRWVAAGRCRDDPLLGRVFRALVRSHTALRDAVPRRARRRPAVPGVPRLTSICLRLRPSRRPRHSASAVVGVVERDRLQPPNFGGVFTARLLLLGADATRQPWRTVLTIPQALPSESIMTALINPSR